MNKNKKKCAAVLLCGVPLLMLLGGCGKSQNSRMEGQSIARVNGEEITVHQINDELTTLDVTLMGTPESASKRILDGLVDQKLAAQKALHMKLDRDPQVLRTIERFKHEILAQAYLNKLVSTVAQPEPKEISEYFNQHPELFSHNKVYSFRSLTVDQPALATDLQAKLDKGTPLDEITAGLRAKDIAFTEDIIVKEAGQLPLDFLTQAYGMAKGGNIVITEGGRSTVFHLVDAVEHPIDLAQAGPLIKNFLLNQRRRQLAETEMNKLRASASIEYLGKFARTHAGNSFAPASASEKSVTQDVAKQPDFMQQGIAGLPKPTF